MTVRWTVRAAEDRTPSRRETESLEVHQKIRFRKKADFLFVFWDLYCQLLITNGKMAPPTARPSQSCGLLVPLRAVKSHSRNAHKS